MNLKLQRFDAHALYTFLRKNINKYYTSLNARERLFRVCDDLEIMLKDDMDAHILIREDW